VCIVHDNRRTAAKGVCQTCPCKGCPNGSKCEDGYCKPQDCVGVRCAQGQHCVAGACVDDCAGAVCPFGGRCIGGRCQPGAVPGSSDGGVNEIAGRDGTDAGKGGKLTKSDGKKSDVGTPSGCGCETQQRQVGSAAALCLLAISVLGFDRRRKLKA
jgi:hypothetical protein